MPSPMMPMRRLLTSTHRLMPRAADPEHLVRLALPPVVLGEDLDLVPPAVAGRLHPRADERDVDHAIPHHAAVEQEIGRRNEPIGDVEREQPLVARALDLELQLRVPPHVVHVDRYADPGPVVAGKLVAQVERLFHRVHARAIGAVHRVQRLDRERHARRARVVEDLADPVAHHLARAGEVLRFLRQPAGYDDEAVRSERRCVIDRAQVVVDRRLTTLAVRGGKEACADEAGDGEAVVADHPRRLLRAGFRHLVPPGRDAADVVPAERVDLAPEIPLLAERRGVDREERGIGRVHASGSTSKPKNRKSAWSWPSTMSRPACTASPRSRAAARNGVISGFVVTSPTIVPSRRVSTGQGSGSSGRMPIGVAFTSRSRSPTRDGPVRAASAGKARTRSATSCAAFAPSRSWTEIAATSAAASAKAIARPAPPAPMSAARRPFGSCPLRRIPPTKPTPSNMSPCQRPAASRRAPLIAPTSRDAAGRWHRDMFDGVGFVGIVKTNPSRLRARLSPATVAAKSAGAV